MMMIPTGGKLDQWKAGSISILATAAMLVISTWHYKNKHSPANKKKIQVQEENERVVVSHKLSDVETDSYMWYDIDVICTLTWYEGDYKDARAKLEKNMSVVIERTSGSKEELSRNITSTRAKLAICHVSKATILTLLKIWK